MAVYSNRSREIAERLILLRDYLYTNATPTHAVKIGDMMDYLESKRYKVEIKTVYRDIEALRNFFYLDIDYDGRQRGYILKNPQFEPYELRMIVNSIQAAQFITQQEADRLTDKIMKELADNYTRPSLNRRTFIPNRVHAVNEDAMKGLDIIYEAIAQDKKISYKYFKYALNGYNKTKEYQKLDGSIIITASPYKVAWENDKFWVYAILKIPKDVWYREGLEYGEEDDYDDIIDFYCDDMDDTRLYVYELYCLDLSFMEQIKVLTEKREGQYTAQKDRIVFVYSEQTKLKADNTYISDIIDKFGNDVAISPVDDKFFIATINGEPTPELYIWTRRFSPPIEIIYPESAETDLRSYFLSLAKDEDVDLQIF